MIRVSVLYPTGPAFDLEYYLSRHMKLVREKLGPALKSVAVEHGLSGPAPNSPPAFQVLCHLGFDSVEAFQAAFAPHAQAIMADIPNYTAAEPVIQIGEVKL